MKRVKIGEAYRFRATGWDRLNRHPSMPEEGDLVRVIELPSDRQCYVECIDGALALVMVDSLSSE